MKPHRRPALRLALAFCLSGSALSLAGAEPWLLDLNSFPLYVRAGWNPKAAGEKPADDAGWKVLPPAGSAGRSARPIELDLPGIPMRASFSLETLPDLDFSYLIPFELEPSAAARYGAAGAGTAIGSIAPASPAHAVPGLHFAGLGDNWEIFLNGVLVRSEMHRDAAGDITDHRSLRDIHFPFDGTLLRAGSNILAVHIVADPGYPPGGFHQADPYILDDYTVIEAMNSELWPITLCGLYLFVGIYHLFIFLVRRKDLHNLFYGLFSVDLAIYLFVRTHGAAAIVPDSTLMFRIELLTLFLILPLVGSFLETLHHDRIGIVTRVYAAFCGLLALVQLFTPAAFSHDLLRLWQFTALAVAVYYFAWEIVGRFVVDGGRRYKRQREGKEARSRISIYLESLVRTPLGNLLIGSTILFGTAIFDILDSIYLQWDLVLTQYGFFVFTMGTAFILANRLGFLHDRLSGLNQDLEERIKVLTETGLRLGASERRYRSLFEGTSIPVAMLDGELRFIEGNSAARELFGLDRPGRGNIRLPDTLHIEEREGDLPIRQLRRAVAARTDGEGISLRVRNALGEPRPCRLQFEHIDSLEGGELLLRVHPEERNALVDAFIEGRERYDIESSLSATDEVCRRATAGLARYLPAEDAGFLAVCVREAVLNAVEHGSLEIDFEEKSKSQREDRYFDFLQERRQDPRFRDRRVTVEYSISAARATFRITDAGPGFDHRRWAGAGDPDPSLLEHGRGLFMTRSAFDEVTFNPKGNQVTLVKWLKKA